jgi:hypothetical protein
MRRRMDEGSLTELRRELRRERARRRKLEIVLEAMTVQNSDGELEAALQRTREELGIALRSWGRLELSVEAALSAVAAEERVGAVG